MSFAGAHREIMIVGHRQADEQRQRYQQKQGSHKFVTSCGETLRRGGAGAAVKGEFSPERSFPKNLNVTRAQIVE
jgi:hypothetical protein